MTVARVKVEFWGEALAQQFLDEIERDDYPDWEFDESLLEDGILVISGETVDVTGVLYEIARCSGGMKDIETLEVAE